MPVQLTLYRLFFPSGNLLKLNSSLYSRAINHFQLFCVHLMKTDSLMLCPTPISFCPPLPLPPIYVAVLKSLFLFHIFTDPLTKLQSNVLGSNLHHCHFSMTLVPGRWHLSQQFSSYMYIKV